MLTKIKSRRLTLPPIYLVENEEDFKQLPKGIPYIIGTQAELRFITIYLEFQVLLRACRNTGLPIKWEECLKRIGYNEAKIRKYPLNSGGEYDLSEGGYRVIELDEFIEDQYIVNFDKLSELKVVPKWLNDLKASIETNIIDEVTFDPTAFSKQLGMNVGYGTIKHNMKNLLILDVSGSIPSAIVKTITLMAKMMSKRFYADVMITSGRTELIDYEKVPETDFVKLARHFGGNNEGEMYNKIIKENKEYNTVICFGDDDSPTRFGGKEGAECNFKVETLYSLHTTSKERLAGYCKAFKPKTTHNVADWVTTIN
jgi:hypothetical protein